MCRICLRACAFSDYSFVVGFRHYFVKLSTLELKRIKYYIFDLDEVESEIHSTFCIKREDQIKLIQYQQR